ncbi:MAG: mechanosensitive ion channel family protein [Acidobacteriota bacterium]
MSSIRPVLRNDSLTRHLAIWLAVMAACLLAPALTAQSAAEAAGKSADEASGAPAPPPEELASPRATLTTFLAAFKEEDRRRLFDLATSTLDLSALPEAAREANGQSLAVQLKDVFDRTEYVDLSLVPDRTTGDPWNFLRDGQWVITIAQQADNAWRFTPATIESIPALWKKVESLEVVEGVTEAPRTVGLWMRSLVPPRLRETTFLLEHWQWIGLVLLLVACYLVAVLVKAILGKILLPQLKRVWENLEGMALHRALRPIRTLLAALLAGIALPVLELPAQVFGFLKASVDLIALVALLWLAYRVIDLVTGFLTLRAEETESRIDDLLTPLIRKTSKFLIVVFGAVFVADNLGLDVASLLAGIGLGGLALALAAQDTFKNLFGSITILLDQPFHVGDAIKIGDVEGTVEEVGMRSTRVRTFYNSLVTVPNASLMTANVDNFGARRFRRWKTLVSVEYDTPVEKIETFCEEIRKLVESNPHTRKDAFYVHLNEFGASSLDIMLYIFFDTTDWAVELHERQVLMVEIIRLAETLGVVFAFPTRTLHLADGQPVLAAVGERVTEDREQSEGSAPEFKRE